MSSLLRTLLALLSFIALNSCGLTKSKEMATKAVETFHQQLNDSKFAEIYSASTPAFKTSSTEADFLKFMQAVRGKLGNYKTGTQSGWRTNATTNGTFVILTYDSQFEQGPAGETFTFVVSGEAAILQGYNIIAKPSPPDAK